MSDKLKDYQVLDVLCGGTFYKVRHKVTNNLFAWKAYDCSAFSSEQIQSAVTDVKNISKVVSDNLLRYYDSILHTPSKTLYFVVEYNEWRSVQELIGVCRATDKHIVESFVWYLLLELARVCKDIEHLNFLALETCITSSSIFINQSCELRVNCFDLKLPGGQKKDVMRQIGNVIQTLCQRLDDFTNDIIGFYYSDDLKDVVSLLSGDKNIQLRPDVILHHPTVLGNVETQRKPKSLSEILISDTYCNAASEANKCDSEKAVEMCRTVVPAPRRFINHVESPIYVNISPKKTLNKEIENFNTSRGSLSPTIAALALELPGFVPRSRKPFRQALDRNNDPKQVSQETFSQHWMSRLIALRQREQSLNKRERDLIGKEIINSPSTKIIPLYEKGQSNISSNGITLPPEIQVACDERSCVAQRRRRPRRKSYAYEELDSTLSADPGDESFIITATKFTKDNMPRRNIFPEISTKKVHFTSPNPFVESDDSVTLTFYELEHVDNEGYQVPRQEEKSLKDISKFKYLNVDKASEKRAGAQWSHSSPSKQAKTGTTLSDISNISFGNLRKTPSKTSLISRGSISSRYSATSARLHWELSAPDIPVSGRTRASTRQSLARTPSAQEEKKPKTRKSILPFKTPFKFKSSSKV